MASLAAEAEKLPGAASAPARSRARSRGLWWDAWWRLRRNKAAVAGLAFILLMFLVALLAPVLAPHDPNAISPTARINTPPFWMEGSDPTYPLGTDSLARDELSRLLYGARVSMIVGFVPTILTLLIGASLGMFSGWLGGRADNLMMRGVDVVYAFPSFLFFIILQASLRDTWLGQQLGGLLLLFVAFALTGWVGMARLVRGQVLSLREREFIEAARAIGVPTHRILLRHILPNTMAPIIVFVSFDVPGLHPGRSRIELPWPRHPPPDRQLGQHGLRELPPDHLPAHLRHHALHPDRPDHDRLRLPRRRPPGRPRSADEPVGSDSLLVQRNR